MHNPTTDTALVRPLGKYLTPTSRVQPYGDTLTRGITYFTSSCSLVVVGEVGS